MILLLANIFGCKPAVPEQGEKPITEDINDTGDTDEEPDEVTECDPSLNTNPINGYDVWFYRNPIELSFDEINVELSVSATDKDGNDIPLTFEWNESYEQASVIPESGTWAGDNEYELSIQYCQNSTHLSFSTSRYGLPLEVDEETGEQIELIGNTYKIDLGAAHYTHPPGVGTLLSQNITNPLLFGIGDIREDEIDFISALGVYDDFGQLFQASGGFWHFSNADFSESPYFNAYSEFLSIEYGTINIPIHHFRITGTFSADAGKIGYAHFEGLGDTREIGPALSSSMDEYAICDMLAGAGTECEICPGETSGEAFCAFLAGEILETFLLNNFELEEPNE